MLHWEYSNEQLGRWFCRKLHLNSWRICKFFKCYRKQCLHKHWTFHVQLRIWFYAKFRNFIIPRCICATAENTKWLCIAWFWFAFPAEVASGWVLAITHLKDRWDSFSLRWCYEYTEMLHIGLHQSSCSAITAIKFPICQGMVWIHGKFHFECYFFKAVAMKGMVYSYKWPIQQLPEDHVVPAIRQTDGLAKHCSCKIEQLLIHRAM